MTDISGLQQMIAEFFAKSLAGNKDLVEFRKRSIDQLFQNFAGVEQTLKKVVPQPEMTNVMAEMERLQGDIVKSVEALFASYVDIPEPVDSPAPIQRPIPTPPAQVTITQRDIAALGDDDLVLLAEVVLGEILSRGRLFPPSIN